MNILLNLIPVTFGGGLQVAANFIDNIARNNGYNHIWWIMVTKDEELASILKNHRYENLIEVSKSPYKRLYFENFEVPKIISKFDIDIIYSYGPGILNKKIPTVVRSAYSNLYYPEIDFWGNWPLKKRIIAKIKDKYRLSMTLKSDALVFENKGMRERAIKNFGYNTNNTFFIKPSVSIFNQELNPDLMPDKFNIVPEDHFNIVMLTAWHKNKNIDKVPLILKELKDRLITNVNYLISVDRQHPYSQELFSKALELGVEKNIYFLGRVKVDEVKYLYSISKASILLSKLECFSSNIIEAWNYKVPLIMANEDWSRSICEDAVIYVDRDDHQIIAEEIFKLMNNQDHYNSIITKGQDQLKTYNTPESKVLKQIHFLEFVHSNYLAFGKNWSNNSSVNNNLSD